LTLATARCRALDALLEFGEPVTIVLSPHGSIRIFGHAFGRWAPMIALGTEIILVKPAIDKLEPVKSLRL
jgi:hypothetical protein